MRDLIRDTTLIDRERYRVRQRREKSPAPGGVWTHDLSVTRRGSNVVLQLLPYNCFTYNPYLPGPLFLSFFLYYFFLAALKVKAANFSGHWFHLFAHTKKYISAKVLWQRLTLLFELSISRKTVAESFLAYHEQIQSVATSHSYESWERVKVQSTAETDQAFTSVQIKLDARCIEK